MPLLSTMPAVTSITFTRWRHTVAQIEPPIHGSTHPIAAYYSFIDPRKDERLSWPGWLTCSGQFTHSSGHLSAKNEVPYRDPSVSCLGCINTQ